MVPSLDLILLKMSQFSRFGLFQVLQCYRNDNDNLCPMDSQLNAILHISSVFYLNIDIQNAFHATNFTASFYRLEGPPESQYWKYKDGVSAVSFSKFFFLVKRV